MPAFPSGERHPAVTDVSRREVDMNLSNPERSPDAGWDAHRAAVAHLQACMEAMFAEDESEGDTVPASPAVGPYCGCTDCDVRETLAVAWPILLADAAAIAEGAGYGAAAEVLRAERTRVQAIANR
jgi:hypothetical protein